MPKVTEEHKVAMRARIQEAAQACFARKGFAAASMADIVKEADLSAGAVYLYYASKSELMIDVGRRIMEQRLSIIDDLDLTGDVPPPSTVFPRLLNAMLDDNPFATLVLQVWGEAAHVPEFAALAAKIFAEVKGRFEGYLEAHFRSSLGLAEADASDRARSATPAVIAMIQGGIVQTAVFGADARTAVTDSMGTVLAGLER